MGYSKTLEAAGAKVLAYEEFGSYQGDWAAFVEFNGEKGIAFGSFGSCSYCDPYQSAFDSFNEPSEKDGKYYKTYWADEENEISKEEYNALIAEQKKKLSDFGSDYLKNISDRAIVETRITNLKSDDWFDGEQKEMLEWCIKQFDTLTPNP